jgi:hypothetical protein
VETCKYGNINELDNTSSPSTIKVTFLVWIVSTYSSV